MRITAKHIKVFSVLTLLFISLISFPVIASYITVNFVFSQKAPQSQSLLRTYLQVTTSSKDSNIATLIDLYQSKSSGIIAIYRDLMPQLKKEAQIETETISKGYLQVTQTDKLTSNVILTISPAVDGKQKITVIPVTYIDSLGAIPIEKSSSIEYPAHGEVVVGIGKEEDIIKSISDLFQQAKTLYTQGKESELKQIMSVNSPITGISNDEKNAMNDAQVASLTFYDAPAFENSLALIASMTIKRNTCSQTGTVEAYYDSNRHEYFLSDIRNAVESLCIPKRSNYGGIIVNCKNCIYAPIGKSYALPSNYVPPLVKTLLHGAGAVTPETKKALTLLFNDASANGISLIIRSSYRSYETQVATFESYVQNEIKNGKTRTQAEAAANTYSARPGHSEHQLGTTVDIRDGEGVYTYLAKNAVRFGFVISYPYNCQALTGYVYEPWHIRYVGTKIASEMSSKGYTSCKNGLYPSKYLEEIKLYEKM
jgi:hypothetical protein